MFPQLLIVTCLILMLALPAMAMGEDPYDPVLGPRRPVPGATAYLETRADISADDKTALLSGRPVAGEVLEKLADAPSREMRSLVAGNRSAPEEVLRRLAHDPESGVRQYVASNPVTPQEILQQLSRDANESVVWSVKHNPAFQAGGKP